jgi:hypothetical protein
MPDFEKRPGAPAGTSLVSVNQVQYAFTDGGVVTVIDREVASNLRAHPWIRETGSSVEAGATYRDRSLVTALSDSAPSVGDVLTRTADGFEWIPPGAAPITQKSTALTGAGTGTATTTSSQLVASQGTRIELTVYNNSLDKEVWLGLGTAAVLGQGPRIPPGGPPFTITSYTGAVNMIVSSGTAAVSYVAI